MPQPDISPIPLHEAPALRCSRDSVRVAWTHPHGNLFYTDTLGPHYSEEDRENARRRATLFLRLVRENQAEIAGAPEYFAPVETLHEVIEDLSILREGTLYVLPLECLSLKAYEDLRGLAEDHSVNVMSTTLETSNRYTFVNPCAILFKSQDGLKVFLQTKISASRAEQPKLAPGQNFFAIEGDHMVLVVIVCSDANPTEYHLKWANAAARKSGAYVVHVQWNPRPDYPQYDHLWSAILDAEDGPKRILFSLNWAPGSSLFSNNRKVREVRSSRTRIFRGRQLQKDSYYPEYSVTGLHVSHRPRNGYSTWEIWHTMSPNEHAYVVEIPRPFENVTPPQSSHDHGIISSDYFAPATDGAIDHFENKLPEGLAIPFWRSCENLGLNPQLHADMDEVPLSDLERLINACLRRPNCIWMLKDVAIRNPTASLLCNRENCDGCTDRQLPCFHSRREFEDDAAYTTECLIEFHRPEVQKGGLKVKPTKLYPLNLVDAADKEAGWLFHGQGLPGRRLEKEIQVLLKQGGLDTFRGLIHLYAVSVRDRIEAENIFSLPSDVSAVGEKGSQDICSAYHGPEIKSVAL